MFKPCGARSYEDSERLRTRWYEEIKVLSKQKHGRRVVGTARRRLQSGGRLHRYGGRRPLVRQVGEGI